MGAAFYLAYWCLLPEFLSYTSQYMGWNQRNLLVQHKGLFKFLLDSGNVRQTKVLKMKLNCVLIIHAKIHTSKIRFKVLCQLNIINCTRKTLCLGVHKYNKCCKIINHFHILGIQFYERTQRVVFLFYTVAINIPFSLSCKSFPLSFVISLQ